MCYAWNWIVSHWTVSPAMAWARALTRNHLRLEKAIRSGRGMGEPSSLRWPKRCMHRQHNTKRSGPSPPPPFHPTSPHSSKLCCNTILFHWNVSRIPNWSTSIDHSLSKSASRFVHLGMIVCDSICCGPEPCLLMTILSSYSVQVC